MVEIDTTKTKSRRRVGGRFAWSGGDNMKRTERIQFRVSEIEKEMAEKLAIAKGIPLADLLRRYISLEVDKYQILKDSARSN